jgi:hypothetical protein
VAQADRNGACGELRLLAQRVVTAGGVLRWSLREAARSVAARHDGGAYLDIVADAQRQHELRVLKAAKSSGRPLSRSPISVEQSAKGLITVAAGMSRLP